jgi:hypothetical protein
MHVLVFNLFTILFICV